MPEVIYQANCGSYSPPGQAYPRHKMRNTR